MYEHGIPIRKDYVIDDRAIDTGAMKPELQYSFPHDMPTAFVCNCDVTALKLISDLEERGYRVPEDISVVGYDDYAFQNNGEIELTTYAVDVKEMARKTLKILLRKMNGEYFNKGVTVVPGRMVIRSTAASVK